MESSRQSENTANPPEDLPILRHRLETQSFLNQSSHRLHELKHWWRFTPAINWLMTLFGIIFAWPQLLYLQAALMAIAVILPSHPFDWLYNYGLRYLTGTAALPKSGQRRRIMFTFASVLIASLGIWFEMGYYMAGYIQGSIMSFLGGLLVVFNLCVLSEILAKIFGMPER